MSQKNPSDTAHTSLKSKREYKFTSFFLLFGLILENLVE